MLLLLLPVLIPDSVKGHRHCNYSTFKRGARAAVCDTQLRSIRCRVFSPARGMPDLFFVPAGNASCVFFSRPLPEWYIIIWMPFASVTCHALLLVLVHYNSTSVK